MEFTPRQSWLTEHWAESQHNFEPATAPEQGGTLGE